MSAPTAAGLENVYALRSSICQLSAEDGRLAYRGYEVRTLGEESTFEETACLLVTGALPTNAELRHFTTQLRAQQKLSAAATRALKAAPAGADAMTALRAVLVTAALEHPIGTPPSHEDAMGQALRLIGITPTIVAAFDRLRRGAKVVLPRKSLDFATNFLTMLHGDGPDPASARALDVALILRAENELNPSTFAARVIASTGADLYAGVIGALSALSGPRHGWHTRHVLAALEEIGQPDNTSEWVRERLARGAKLPGFGHQVYKGEDPRTVLLRTLAERECGKAGRVELYQSARELESLALRETGQHPIVDFYLAPLYCALGIPTDLFTTVFAISRMPGWVAHLLEQYTDDKLIRPRAEYIGPVGLEYRAIRKRR